jgi:hypothetical protein
MIANNTFYDNALVALHGLGKEAAALHRDNVKLSQGVAAQAKIIRELREELSKVQANLDIQTYNVEFLKVQARRTRLKLRSAKRGRKQAYDSIRVAQASVDKATATIEGVLADNAKLRMDNRQLDTIITNRNLEITSLKGALDRVQAGRELPLTMVVEPQPIRTRKIVTPFGGEKLTQIDVKMVGHSFVVAPEHRRNVEVHALLARKAAQNLTVKIEQAILDALRGELTDMNEVRRKVYDARMAEQRQTYGIGGVLTGRKADLIIADDIEPRPTSQCDCAVCKPTDF